MYSVLIHVRRENKYDISIRMRVYGLVQLTVLKNERQEIQPMDNDMCS
jgi:hypothetical protein